MHLFYVHAGGDTAPHELPLRDGQAPVFTLSAIAVHERTWRHLHRGYVELQQRYFGDLTGAARADAFVIPAEPGSTGEHADFLRDTLRLCESFDVVASAASFIKSTKYVYEPDDLYRRAMQYLADRLQHFLATRPEPHQGILIFDRDTGIEASSAQAHVDALLASGDQSLLVETPLLADAALSSGVQLASIIGQLIHANTVFRYCRDIEGVPDFEALTAFWPYLDRLQFRGPPMAGETGITYGYRAVREPDSPTGDLGSTQV
jgi:hypothetical protein